MNAKVAKTEERCSKTNQANCTLVIPVFYSTRNSAMYCVTTNPLFVFSRPHDFARSIVEVEVTGTPGKVEFWPKGKELWGPESSVADYYVVIAQEEQVRKH